LVTDAYFSGTKVAWILDNIAGAREKAEAGKLAFGQWTAFSVAADGRAAAHYGCEQCQPDDVVRHPQALVVEFDLKRLNVRLRCCRRLCQAAWLRRDGRWNVRQADSDCGDGGRPAAATFGQACYEAGMAKNTYGTGCFMLMNTGSEAKESNNNLLTTVGWTVGESPMQYALEGSVFIAGAAVQWLRDEMS